MSFFKSVEVRSKEPFRAVEILTVDCGHSLTIGVVMLLMSGSAAERWGCVEVVGAWGWGEGEAGVASTKLPACN